MRKERICGYCGDSTVSCWFHSVIQKNICVRCKREHEKEIEQIEMDLFRKEQANTSLYKIHLANVEKTLKDLIDKQNDPDAYDDEFERCIHWMDSIKHIGHLKDSIWEYLTKEKQDFFKYEYERLLKEYGVDLNKN